MEESQAIASLKQGDIRGLEALVYQYFLPAVRAAYLIVHDQALAEDVAQSSFIHLPEKIGQYDESRPFRPWFLRSVVNRAISAARKQNRFVSLDHTQENGHWQAALETLDVRTHSLEDELISEEARQEIWQALQKLNPQQRAAVVMRYYLELSEQEIAEEMARPRSTVKWTLYTARQKLQGLLRPQHSTPSQEKKSK